MTIIPETRLIYRKTLFINMNVDEKIILKIIKTTLKPEIKLIVLAISLGLYSVPEGELPIIHRYDGMSGSTQGDKKESTPAPNAIKIDIFSVISLLSYPQKRRLSPPVIWTINGGRININAHGDKTFDYK
jgi:hypothetical protein